MKAGKYRLKFSMRVHPCPSVVSCFFIRLLRIMRLPCLLLEDAGHPDEQIGDDFAAIQFVKHFVPAAWIEIMGDRGEARAAIAACEREHAFQPLANRIVAAGEHIDR